MSFSTLSTGHPSKPSFRRPDPRLQSAQRTLCGIVLPRRSKGSSCFLCPSPTEGRSPKKDLPRSALSDRSPYRFSGELRAIRPNLRTLARRKLVTLSGSDSGSRTSLPRRVGQPPRRLPNSTGKNRSRCRPLFLSFLNLSLPWFRDPGLSGGTLDRICCDLASSPSRSLFSRPLLHHPSRPVRWTPTCSGSRSPTFQNFS